jgi:hypothetical protein
MMALIYDLVAFMTEQDGKRFRANAPAQTWNALLVWIREQAGKKDDEREIKLHQTGTWRAIYRRLWDILAEGESVFPRDARSGRPLHVTRSETSPPQVIDIHDLPTSLQRFVVAAIVKQVVAARTGRNVIRGLRYLLMLDELNRFAPRNNNDPITQLLERVASEMRSRGIILLARSNSLRKYPLRSSKILPFGSWGEPARGLQTVFAGMGQSGATPSQCSRPRRKADHATNFSSTDVYQDSVSCLGDASRGYRRHTV